MDTRESKTREEVKQHMLDERLPEDMDNPQPDAEQPESQRPPSKAHNVLPIVPVIIGLLMLAGIAYFLFGL